MQRLQSLFLILALCLSGRTTAKGQPADTISEDFVIASICVVDAGDALYSRAGHSFFRMQCPDYGKDFCFSYESEEVTEKVMTFLSGDLKMGLCGIKTERYLRQFADAGREVREYRLNLPIRVKQNLWRVLDTHVKEGMYLPYDYLKRGCAISVLHCLEEALDTITIDYGEFPEYIQKHNRREILSDEIAAYPWSRLCINILTNGSANDFTVDEEKLVTPRILVQQLQQAKVGGRQLLSAGNVLVKAAPKPAPKTGLFTPMNLSLLVLLLTVLTGVLRIRAWDYVLLTLLTLLGLVNVYLVFFSSLCATEWSWLIVPFNPLPLLHWKWRTKWALPYAAVILVWIVCMLLVPHSLTDTSLIVLAAAIMINCALTFLTNYKKLQTT